jgi:hypothetical protein
MESAPQTRGNAKAGPGRSDVAVEVSPNRV